MAQVRRPTHHRPWIGQDNKQLFIGMLLGAILMFWYLGPTTIIDDVSSSATSALRTSAEDTGWHAIHVYYGQRNSMPGLVADQKWFAQVHQDEIVLDLLGPGGYFLDLAANDAVEFSNTLALERHGWQGLCIEPNPTYWYGLSHRKCTVVGALVGSRQEQVQVKFRGVFGGIVGKLDDKLANRKREPQAKPESRYTAPLTELLQKFNVPSSIDYMSLDVEGAELMIMQVFPFEKYQIKVLSIERPSNDLRLLLEKHGYIFLKDLAWWGETLWAHSSTGFTPQHPKIVKIQTEERN